MPSLQVAIDNAIRTRLEGTTAVPVERDAQTQQLCTLHDAAPEEGRVAYVGPVTSNWAESRNLRAGAKREIADWSWRARVEFRRPVDVSLFQQALADDVFVAEDKTDPTNPVEPFRIELQSVQHDDPPHSESQTGSVLVVEFNARPQRR